MTYDPTQPAYFDAGAAGKDLARITEICDGCRRCHRLCSTFDFMLDTVDAHEGDLAKIASGDYRRMVDLCWQCKLCFNHCPYTPPHRWNIDFPRLMQRAKAARVKAEGIPAHDRALADPDRVGSLGSAFAPLSNWANTFKPHRVLLEAATGVHRDRTLPKFHRQTFARWFKGRPARPIESAAPLGSGGIRPPQTPPATRLTRPTALFHTCIVNYNEPEVGKDAVAVLEKNGCAVTCPDQVCCGIGYLDAGDIAGATANARRNITALLPTLVAGGEVVVPQPTCSYVIKKEYPLLVPGEESEKLAARTFDLFEYLAMRHREGTLSTDFAGPSPGKVAYQVPCHLRAQNMGFKTRDILQLVPGTKVTLVERCTAMDGTWGMKKEFYPLSLDYARKAAADMEAATPDTWMTDCSLAALQIQDVSGKKPQHPATVLRKAYGLPEEA
ncbi:MAG TPA: heterodisulfide reductase-related iron-sulfur binding cluster [Vicinamibacteria bacterium]|nr:heterodisulfide reductase-related iron-sulfur binding cluster [Vicinamibacteria bacterium]